MKARLGALALCLLGVWLLWPADGPAQTGAAPRAPLPAPQADRKSVV